MSSKSFCRALAIGALAAVALAAQFRGFQAATVAAGGPIELKPGEKATAEVVVRVRAGYHINSDKPLEEYLIPTALTWEAPSLRLESTEYPEAEIVKYSFSDSPLSLYSGEFVIRSTFLLPKGATKPDTLKGELRYQACNDKACLAPTTAEIEIPVR